MTKLALLAAALIITSTSAFACDDAKIVSAENALDLSKRRYNNGAAGIYEVKLSEKALSEAKLCAKEVSQTHGSLVIYADLITGALERLDLATKLVETGATMNDLNLAAVAAEVAGYRATCPLLVQKYEFRYERGTLEEADLKLITETCAKVTATKK